MPRPNPQAPVRRVIDTGLWTDPKVIALGPPKSSPLMLFIFLATHPSSGRIPGVLIESVTSIAGRLNWKVTTVREMLQTLAQQGLIQTDLAHWLVWLPAAIKYNPPSGPREIAAWAQHWNVLPACSLKDRIATELTAHLAATPALADAFAKHCLGLEDVPVEVVPARAPEPKVKAKAKPAKAELDRAQWESEFSELWPQYPKRAGSNPKGDALKCFIARRRDDKIAFDEIKAGLERYRHFCEATHKIGTEKVLQATTFFGVSKRFAESWELPADLVIAAEPDAVVTCPGFEQVFAAYPRQDDKAGAWATWQRIQPTPDAALVKRMRESIGEWKGTRLWRDDGGARIPSLAKWLQATNWNRRFDQSGGADASTLAAILNGGAPNGGLVIEGQAVERKETRLRPSDPFVLN